MLKGEPGACDASSSQSEANAVTTSNAIANHTIARAEGPNFIRNKLSRCDAAGLSRGR